MTAAAHCFVYQLDIKEREKVSVAPAATCVMTPRQI